MGCDLPGLVDGLGECGHVPGFRARPASRGRVGSLAALGLGSVPGGLRSRVSRTSSRALPSRLFPFGLARLGRRSRRTRPRAGPRRAPLVRLCAIPSCAHSLALAPLRVYPRWPTSFLSRDDDPSLAAPGGGSGLVASSGRFGPRRIHGPVQAWLRYGCVALRVCDFLRYSLLSGLRLDVCDYLRYSLSTGLRLVVCGLLRHPAKISPGPCDHADGVVAGLPTGWAGLVPRRRLGQRKIKSDFAECNRRLLGQGAS